MAKLVLTVTVIVTAVGITNGWVERAAAGHASPWLVVAGSASHLLLLTAATLISVDKPWGPTRRGSRTVGR